MKEKCNMSDLKLARGLLFGGVVLVVGLLFAGSIIPAAYVGGCLTGMFFGWNWPTRVSVRNESDTNPDCESE